MAFEIKLSAVAQKELEESVDWYNPRVYGLGKRLLKQLINAWHCWLKPPDMFPVKLSGYNEVLVEDFPYLIVYKIIKKGNKVQILHVFHTKRNPVLKNKRN